MHFAVYEAAKRWLGCDAEYGFAGAALSGATATVISDACMTPFDVIKQRLQARLTASLAYAVHEGRVTRPAMREPSVQALPPTRTARGEVLLCWVMESPQGVTTSSRSISSAVQFSTFHSCRPGLCEGNCSRDAEAHLSLCGKRIAC